MRSKVYTLTYFKTSQKATWDELHLYEHLLISSFEGYIEKKGISRITYGWLNGETYPGTIFLEAGFYAQSEMKLFTAFIEQSETHIDFELLDTELRIIQSEDQSIIKKINKQELIQKLLTIDSLAFRNLEDQNEALTLPLRSTDPLDPSITLKPSKRLFKKFSVVVSLDREIENSVVFLRLLPILYKIIDTTLKEHGVYAIDNDALPHFNTHRNSLYGIAAYSIRKSDFDGVTLEDSLVRAINEFNLLSQEEELSRYAEAFSSISTWNTLPIDYWKNTNILVSRNHIMRLFQPEILKKVLQKIKVTIES